MPHCNVLRVNSVEERADYQEAVAEILRGVLASHKTTLLQIAEDIDVSLGTISNAANKKGVLNAIYLKRLGQKFGVKALGPYAELCGGRMVPIEVDPGANALPSASAAVHRLCVATAPDSPGGTALTHTELLEIEPIIDDAIRALSALKVRAIEIRTGKNVGTVAA